MRFEFLKKYTIHIHIFPGGEFIFWVKNTAGFQRLKLDRKYGEMMMDLLNMLYVHVAAPFLARKSIFTNKSVPPKNLLFSHRSEIDLSYHMPTNPSLPPPLRFHPIRTQSHPCPPDTAPGPVALEWDKERKGERGY